MARQYFRSPLVDSLITPISAVTPTTVETSIFSVTQATKFLALPFGQNAPSPGQVFRVRAGGLITTPASGTIVIGAYHGAGAAATTFGTLLGKSNTITPPFSVTAGYWRLEGDLIYRTISEIATTSTAWFSGKFSINGPSGAATVTAEAIISSGAAISVDTTGTGALAASWGALNFTITEGTTGSTITPEWAYSESVN